MLIILLALMSWSCDTDESLGDIYQTTFVKYYGGEGNQEGVDVNQLADGGFMILGNSITTEGNSRLILIRTDENGNELWSNTYGGLEDEVAVDMEIDQNNIIYVASNLDDGGNADIVIYKIDMEGEQVDSVIYGGVNSMETASDLLITSNGEIMVVGTTDSEGGNDVLSYRLNPDLSKVSRWLEIIGFGDEDIDDFGECVLEEDNGDLVFFVSSNTPAVGNTDKEGFNFYVYKTDNEGSVISFNERFYGNANDQFLSKARFTLSKGTVMVGTSRNQSGFNQLYVSRTRSNFGLVYENQITTVDNRSGVDVMETLNGQILITGNILSGENSDLYLTRLNSVGEVIWTRTFGGLGVDETATIYELQNEEIMMVGTVELENQKKIALFKTDSKGNLGY